MKLTGLIYLLALLCVLQSKQIYMASVYRHGARYPIYDYYDYNDTK